MKLYTINDVNISFTFVANLHSVSPRKVRVIFKFTIKNFGNVEALQIIKYSFENVHLEA